MPDLDLPSLPPELHAALEVAWPGCPEAQRRALLGPRPWAGWRPLWPDTLWAWRPAGRWWRPFSARRQRRSAEAYFVTPVSDVLESRQARLFDPEQPFFETPWTEARVLLRSPVPEVFSDGEFWAITQMMFGGDVYWAGREAEAWARGMQADNALSGSRREDWLADAQWRLKRSATGDYA